MLALILGALAWESTVEHYERDHFDHNRFTMKTNTMRTSTVPIACADGKSLRRFGPGLPEENNGP